MYQKIRKKLTHLSGSIITLIIIAVSIGYLSITGKEMTNARMENCIKDIRSIVITLDSGVSLSNSWKLNVENNGKYILSGFDSGSELMINSLHNNEEVQLTNLCWQEYRRLGATLTKNNISFSSYYKSFEIQNGLCFVITYGEKEKLELMLYSPSYNLKNQLWQQRITFLAIMGVALIAIWIFLWFFIDKLLKPIEESQQNQNHFVAAASHELRTPLAVIISCIEDLNMNGNLTQDNKEAIDVISKESYRMSSLLTQMLTLSTKDSGHFELNKTEVELDTLIITVYESFEAMMNQKSITCLLDLPETGSTKYLGDYDKLYQVISILIHNAISYTPVMGHINLRLTKEKETFIIEVADNGPGIPDADKSKIFNRFYRSESARSTKGHFGLGLAIAYEIVDAHGGRITVFDTDNEQHRGSTFRVRL